MKVYTKTGDKGETSLIGGSRVAKDELSIEAYGTVDELNAFVGLLLDKLSEEGMKQQLLQVQNYLFVIGSHLANDRTKSKIKLPPLDSGQSLMLESWIDDYQTALPPMTHFILPSGHECVSLSHCARTICRRAERRVVAMDVEWHEEILVYLNRLSDYLFVLSRKIAQDLNVKEEKWKPNHL